MVDDKIVLKNLQNLIDADDILILGVVVITKSLKMYQGAISSDEVTDIVLTNSLRSLSDDVSNGKTRK